MGDWAPRIYKYVPLEIRHLHLPVQSSLYPERVVRIHDAIICSELHEAWETVLVRVKAERRPQRNVLLTCAFKWYCVVGPMFTHAHVIIVDIFTWGEGVGYCESSLISLPEKRIQNLI